MALEMPASAWTGPSTAGAATNAVDTPSNGVRTGTAAFFAQLRTHEYGRLDAAGHAYLDYTGAGLYAASQIDAHHRRLQREVLGNPHSQNPASAESTARVERARRRVLDFLRAAADEYEVVFTTNASAALRLVAEAFPFRPGSRFVLTADNHNSVNGVRCHADRAGAEVQYVPLERTLRSSSPEPFLNSGGGGPSLFAFPAQSNYSGVRHPLGWVATAAARGYRVLLDAAAFVPTAPLWLDRAKPDFVCLSFYKMFGYPTGIGALVTRREALEELERPWFAGGTVDWVSTRGGGHALRSGAEAFEDGTPHFLAADAVIDGLDHLERIGIGRIEGHVSAMAARLIKGLAGLFHRDGAPLVDIHGPTDMGARGGTIAFNVLARDGSVVSFEDVVARAGLAGVSVRGGCFCNPGCAEASLSLDESALRRCRERLRRGFTPVLLAECIGAPVGAVRASTGIATTTQDVDRLLGVIESYAA